MANIVHKESETAKRGSLIAALKSAALFDRVSLQEKINFTRHLAIITKAGIPLFEGLKILRRQAMSKTLIRIIDSLMGEINNGQSLASGLANYKHIFGDFYISIVEVGEASGTLSDNLMYLAEEMKKGKILRNKVRSAMIYPSILFIMTIGVSAFLTFVVFPKILPTFASLNVQLPLTTRILIQVLNFLKNFSIQLLVVLVAVIIGFRLLMKIQKVKYAVDMVGLYLPVVAPLTIDVNMANFTRILAILLKSGVKIVEAVIIVSNTMDNLVYKRKLQQGAEDIKKGDSFAQYLAKSRRIFPSLLSAMIEVGENTGNLEENLFYLAEYYTDEVDNSLKNLTALMEPLILLIMGLVVGFVALSIITPIYSITQGLQ